MLRGGSDEFLQVVWEVGMSFGRGFTLGFLIVLSIVCFPIGLPLLGIYAIWKSFTSQYEVDAFVHLQNRRGSKEVPSAQRRGTQLRSRPVYRESDPTLVLPPPLA